MKATIFIGDDTWRLLYDSVPSFAGNCHQVLSVGCGVRAVWDVECGFGCSRRARNKSIGAFAGAEACITLEYLGKFQVLQTLWIGQDRHTGRATTPAC